MEEEKEISNSYSTSSVSSTSSDSDEEGLLFLKEMENRNTFLRGVALFFLLYATLGFGMMLLIRLDQRSTKYVYRFLQLDKRFLFLTGLSLSIKLLMGFTAHYLLTLAYSFYLIDCLLYPFICLGLWYYFEESQRVYQIANGYWVIVFVVSFFAISLFYYLSTLFRLKKYRYNFYIGFCLMLISTLTTMKLVDYLWLNSPMIWQVWTICIVTNILIILYFCMLSFVVVNYRGEQYRENEAIVCYWNFYIDWFSFMWIDYVANTKLVRKKLKKRKRDKRRKEKLKRKLQHQLEKRYPPRQEKSDSLDLHQEVIVG